MKKMLLLLALCPLLCCCRGNDTKPQVAAENAIQIAQIDSLSAEVAIPSVQEIKAQEPAPKAEDKPVGHIVAEVIQSLCAAIAMITICIFTFVASVVIWHKFLEIIS